MNTTCAYGSLDDLVSATVADFAVNGIDSLTKLSLLEAAWTRTVTDETPAAYALCLGSTDTPEVIQIHLEQLTAAGLLIREGDCFRLNEASRHRALIARLRAFWSDRELQARAAPLLRFRPA